MNGIDIFSFNWFDILIVTFIIISLLVSFFRGFLREAVSLVIWLVAIVLGLKFSGMLSGLFSFLGSPLIANFVAFLCIVVIVLILGSVLNSFIRSVVERGGFGVIDNLLGAVFGALRGILLVATILLFLQAGSWAGQSWMKDSQLRPHFQPLVQWLNTFGPEKLHQVAKWVGIDYKA